MPTIVINPDYDGYVYFKFSNQTYYKVENPASILIGRLTTPTKDYELYRAFFRYPLDALPLGEPVTKVRRMVNCILGGGANHYTDDHAYRSNGQYDPQEETNLDYLYSYCALGNLYQDDSVELRTTGEKWAKLGGSIYQDIMNAKSAGTKFSLSMHEEGDDDYYAEIDARLGTIPPKLEITYGIAGYSYSDGLVCIQCGSI